MEKADITTQDDLDPEADSIVLHRLRPRPESPWEDTPGTLLGVVVDCETTGTGPDAEIIEVAAARFSYQPGDGSVVGVHGQFAQLRQPSAPIPAAVTALTGITDSMVEGKSIDLAALAEFVAPARLVIAHNARFDRGHLERLHPSAFESRAWACSIEDAGWDEEAVESTKLSFIAGITYHFFYERHRATSDCEALIEILGRPAPRTGRIVLSKVLESARRGRYRLRAFDTRYAERELLRARGYRWEPGGPGRPKAWARDFLDEAAAEAERAEITTGFLALAGSASIERLSAFTRFKRA